MKKLQILKILTNRENYLKSLLEEEEKKYKKDANLNTIFNIRKIKDKIEEIGYIASVIDITWINQDIQ